MMDISTITKEVTDDNQVILKCSREKSARVCRYYLPSSKRKVYTPDGNSLVTDFENLDSRR